MSLFSYRATPPPESESKETMRSLPRLLKDHVWDLFFLNICCLMLFMPLLWGVWLFLAGAPAFLAAGVILGSVLLAAPACRGICRTVRQMADGCCYEPFAGFFRALFEEYPRSLALGLFYHLALTALLWAGRFFLWSLTSTGGMGWGVLLWFCLLGGVIVLGSVFHAYMMLANIELGLGNILRNAFLLGAANIRRTLLSLGTVMALSVLCFLAVPYTLSLVPLCYFSLIFSVCGWLSWQSIREHIAKPSPQNESL